MLASIPASRLNHTPPDSDILNDSQQPHPALEAIGYFLWLGMTGFGGPVVVQPDGARPEQMRDVIAVCQTNARRARRSDGFPVRAKREHGTR
jgi:hypothetical protein